MSYRIQVLETGACFSAERDESLLAAALRADVPLAHDCQFGGCGTCRVKVHEGTLDYEEFPLGLTEEEAQAGFALACQARPRSDIVIGAGQTGAPTSEPARHTVRVEAVRLLAHDVTHLTLALPEDAEMIYRPGQYMNVMLEDGSHRSFSMASAARAGGLVDFHVRKIAGGRFTDRVVAQLKPGDRLDVELPLGGFRLHEEDYRPLLMVATGTGLAPVKAMLESLMDDPDCPPVTLYWGARTADGLYLHDEIGRWAERLYEFRYVPVLSRADTAWSGRRGYVQRAVCEDHADLSEHAVYLCGSPAMIAEAKAAFIAKGASVDHLYSDSFTFQHAAAALV
ncbi:2Fe-2S iron-sulfur cluster-binding protein [Paraburkholderia tuberum]|uniref:CDP-4-dehydro-6-deoxyglucose reductase n=1 Tax=Paraburkholderia tuberum TaxID=157910 RepID=A0A1H1JID2_9BURK|nr:2Fe-2S iron-sulfur cluster-binding protein [Paraburkholderia tuberum]SDR49734.1 CDP-4-dehydro-6-deoxyglucose reductase [Paraburkholderia tuberum]